MRPSPFILIAMLAAALMAGCSEDPLAVSDPSAYQTSSTATTPTTDQDIYTGFYPSSATASPTPVVSPDPLAGSGVTAQVTEQQPRGLFKKTLELTVRVINQDSVERTGYLVATFKDSAGKTDLQYLYVTVAAGSIQSVTITSSIAATTGTVVFRERFL